MKKLTYLFLALIIVACSSDSENDNNNNNPNESELLVSSISYNLLDNSNYEYVENFSYDGNKIVEMNRSGYYNGSFISVGLNLYMLIIKSRELIIILTTIYHLKIFSHMTLKGDWLPQNFAITQIMNLVMIRSL